MQQIFSIIIPINTFKRTSTAI